jgi:hypothetical protein
LIGVVGAFPEDTRTELYFFQGHFVSRPLLQGVQLAGEGSAGSGVFPSASQAR